MHASAFCITITFETLLPRACALNFARPALHYVVMTRALSAGEQSFDGDGGRSTVQDKNWL